MMHRFLLVCWLFLVSSTAQSQQATSFLADRMSISASQVLVAEGNVEVIQGSRRLAAAAS